LNVAALQDIKDYSQEFLHAEQFLLLRIKIVFHFRDGDQQMEIHCESALTMHTHQHQRNRKEVIEAKYVLEKASRRE
jgi:hypothetical protein